MTYSPYGQQIDGPTEFMNRRDDDISNMGKDTNLQKSYRVTSCSKRISLRLTAALVWCPGNSVTRRHRAFTGNCSRNSA